MNTDVTFFVAPLNSDAPLPLVPAPTLLAIKGSFAFRARLKITVVSMGIGLILTAMNPPLAALSLPAEWSLELLGWACFCAGAAIRIWSLTYICDRKSCDVVRTGPYSVCRNPLYWGTFLMVAAFSLLLRSPILAAVMLPPILLYLFGVVPYEEAVMRSRHGSEYDSYCRAVPRWWPNLFGYVQGEPLDGHSKGLTREYSATVGWVVLAIGLDMAFSPANTSWWVHPLHWW